MYAYLYVTRVIRDFTPWRWRRAATLLAEIRSAKLMYVRHIRTRLITTMVTSDTTVVYITPDRYRHVHHRLSITVVQWCVFDVFRGF